MTARLTDIFIASKPEKPMQSLESVRALAGQGLEGDRYTAGEGTFSSWPGNGRHLTLVAREDLDSLPAEVQITAEQSRRNLVTEGLELTDLIGKRLRMGEVLIEVTRFCEPCETLEQRLQKPGLIKAMAGKGGLRAEILEGGVLQRGMAIEVLCQS